MPYMTSLEPIHDQTNPPGPDAGPPKPTIPLRSVLDCAACIVLSCSPEDCPHYPEQKAIGGVVAEEGGRFPLARVSKKFSDLVFVIC